MNSDCTGKKLVIQYKMDFKIGRDLPFIKISHKIPNIKYLADSIINLESENELLQSRISTNKKYLNDKNEDILNANTNIKELEKEIHQIKDIRKRCNYDKKIKLKKSQIIENRKIETENIKRLNENIINSENVIKEDEQTLAKEKDNLIKKEFEHKKLALLIFDQLEKNIPQSLFEYIKIASDLENKEMKGYLIKNQKNYLKAKNEHETNIKLFLENYKNVQSTLKNNVINHLKN